jgi:carbonic anhydrase
MSNLDSMLERNKDFAAQQSAAGTLMPSLPEATPNLKAMIIGCADMRVDPAHLLGLKPGEALVLRNIGGRITPVLLQELGMLGRVGQVMGKVAGGGGEFHLVVLQHTDCGITRLAGDPAILARYFQIEEGKVEIKAVTDPRAAVAGDVALLKTLAVRNSTGPGSSPPLPARFPFHQVLAACYFSQQFPLCERYQEAAMRPGDCPPGFHPAGPLKEGVVSAHIDFFVGTYLGVFLP